MATEKTIKNADEIFFFDRLRKYEQFISGKTKFVHYTSAQAAMSFIKNREVWLRNTRCMNDYLEIQHGLDCLIKAFHSKVTGVRFKNILSRIDKDMENKLVHYFDGWIPKFKYNTYVTCISEHSESDDKFGKLSMWRAYGGRQSVAIVLNSLALQRETTNNVFEVDITPVIYQDASGFEKTLGKLTNRIKSNLDFIDKMESDDVFAYLFKFFQNALFTVKHQGFAEEREWRAIYNPSYKKSEYVAEEIICINGIPQLIHKIPIKNIPKEGLTGFEISDLIDKIIIGPNDNQIILGEAFIELLKNAGCNSPEDRIHYSGIPIRWL